MPEGRSQYLRQLLQPKTAEASAETPPSTADLLRKRREKRAKREAEIQKRLK